MTNENLMDALESAYQWGQKHQASSLTERVASLDQFSRNSLANFAILGLPLSFAAIKDFFEISELNLSEDQHLAWLIPCLEMNLLQKHDNAENRVVTWQPRVEVFSYFSKNLENEDFQIYHLNADRFILEQFVDIAETIGFQLPDDDNLREAIIGPHKFLYQISNQPQHQKFHQIVINLSVNWFGHLFQLEKYNEAAQILNSIFESLARRGQPEMAKNMLAAISSKTEGLNSIVALMNLATLLRREKKLSPALRLYRHSIPKLLALRAFIQLAQVLNEMATAYNELGKSRFSALVLEFSIILHKKLKNKKSIAIAKEQLASTYRYLKMYSWALKNSKRAINYFRETHDFLNLGRSLVTRGNILYFQKNNVSAMQCFDEAFEIGEKTVDNLTIINALSGKALVFLESKQYDEAQTLLEQVISMRERNNDHNIGVEYHNMGFLLEQKGEFAVALGWYRKALIQFEKYIPVDVPNCRRCISRAESKYKRQRSRSRKISSK